MGREVALNKTYFTCKFQVLFIQIVAVESLQSINVGLWTDRHGILLVPLTLNSVAGDARKYSVGFISFNIFAIVTLSGTVLPCCFLAWTFLISLIGCMTNRFSLIAASMQLAIIDLRVEVDLRKRAG